MARTTTSESTLAAVALLALLAGYGGAIAHEEVATRHRPAAAVVAIVGAAGPNAERLNGRYQPTADREVYTKIGAPNRWLFVNSNDEWMASSTAGKDDRRANSVGCAHSVSAASGLPPAASGGQWQVSHGEGYGSSRPCGSI